VNVRFGLDVYWAKRFWWVGALAIMPVAAYLISSLLQFRQ
jgi:hypothetical protein